MSPKPAPLSNVRKQLQLSLFKSLLVPFLILAFFISAPAWLNSKLHTQIKDAVESNPNLSFSEKEQRLERMAEINFQQVCLDCPPGLEKLHDNFERNGIVGNFQRLRWGLILSVVLAVGLSVAVLVIYSQNNRAKNSPDNLIGAYRLSWKIGMAAALAKIFLLIPLLAYGTFEFSILLTDHYYPKLLLIIVLGGLFALWRSAAILLKKVPLEFKEPLSREVTAEEAPELWRIVRYAAEQLQTTPPDRILIGLQLNFFVTELAVIHDEGRVEGKTLYLSYPLLKQLSEDEVLAIVGHELGHFIGKDTRMTREFYPLRLKVRATMFAMASAGWVGWPSVQLLNYFSWCFGETERAASRERELLADEKAARLTSAPTFASALIRFQVAVEVFHRGFKEAVAQPSQNPMDIPLQALVQEKLAPDTAFWTQLFEKKLPHPLDTHPSLQVRLEALNQHLGVVEAQAIALKKSESAFEKWFASRDALFTKLKEQANALVAKMRSKTMVQAADYQTEAGRQLLEQHFPERRWTTRQSSVWLIVSLLGIIFLPCLAAVIFINDSGLRIIFAIVLALLGFGMLVMFKRHYRAVLILTAEGIQHPGWKRPLRFQDVEKILVRRSYSNVILTFRLKTRQPPRWKCSLIGLPRKTTVISLNYLEGKPLVTAQTIFDYFKRQIRPDTTAKT